MNISFDVRTTNRRNPEIAVATVAAVPPALQSVLRGMTVTALYSMRLLAESIAKAALASTDHALASVDIVLSDGN